MESNEVKKTTSAIKAALKARSSIKWSVTSARGSSYGWIEITAAPARLVDGLVTMEDRAELGRLFGVAPMQTITIPSQGDFYREYIDRAQGKTPSVIGKPNW